MTHFAKCTSEDNKGGDLSFFIKISIIANAAGAAGAAYIIALPTLAEDDFFVAQVVGLSHVCLPGAKSFLYICHSRSGCPAMWDHWFEFFVVPFMEECAQANRFMTDANGDPFDPVLTMDGELGILARAFSQRVLAAFKRIRASVVKLGASATIWEQALDAYTIFRCVFFFSQHD